MFVIERPTLRLLSVTHRGARLQHGLLLRKRFCQRPRHPEVGGMDLSVAQRIPLLLDGSSGARHSGTVCGQSCRQDTFLRAKSQSESQLHQSRAIGARYFAPSDGVRAIAGLAGRGKPAATEIYAAPPRVIESVECFKTKLQIRVFTAKPGKLKCLAERAIPIVAAWTRDRRSSSLRRQPPRSMIPRIRKLNGAVSSKPRAGLSFLDFFV